MEEGNQSLAPEKEKKKTLGKQEKGEKKAKDKDQAFFLEILHYKHSQTNEAVFFHQE